MMTIEDIVIKLVAQNANYLGVITGDKKISGELGIDSLTFISLIIKLENQFNISIDEKLMIENGLNDITINELSELIKNIRGDRDESQ